MIRALHSEQIKLTTLRSTWWTIGITIIGSVVSAFLIAGVLDGEDAVNPVAIVANIFLLPSLFALVILMVMGIVVSTSEYRFGQVRMTFTADPRRWQVLLAKAIVVSGTAFVVGAITSWLSVLLAKAALDVPEALDLGNEQVRRMVWGMPLFFAVAALLAMSLGALLRSSPAAITIVTVFSLAIEKILLGFEKTQDFAKYLPFNAGIRILQGDSGDYTFTDVAPWDGFWLFTGYAVVLFVLAVILVEIRDA